MPREVDCSGDENIEVECLNHPAFVACKPVNDNLRPMQISVLVEDKVLEIKPRSQPSQRSQRPFNQRPVDSSG